MPTLQHSNTPILRQMTAVICCALISLCLVTVGCRKKAAGPAANGSKQLRVLCTTFPMYQITRNVVGDNDQVRVDLLLPASLGCPHNYPLTTQDMQNLAVADVLVVNGLGLEEFLDAPLKKANAEIRIIDSSAGIEDIIPGSGASCDHHGCEGHDHDDDRNANPHLFVSPRMNARLAQVIATELAKIAPASAKSFTDNAAAYAKRLETLANDLSALGEQLKNRRIVQPHGAFDYLARDLGLEIVAVMQAHGQQPAAAEMIALAKTLKAERVGAIFTEPQYPDRVGRRLSKETGVPFAVLDPAANGPTSAPLDHYETTMRKNMETLKTVLGTK